MGVTKGDEALWLGLAYPDYVPAMGEEDAYFSKLGGTVCWLHTPEGVVRCKNDACGKKCAFVGQLHAPLKSFTRVLYIFACTEEACQGKASAWTLLRGQVHHVDWEQGKKPVAAPEAAPVAAPAGAAFEVDDDWGDDDNAFDGGFGGNDEGAFGAAPAPKPLDSPTAPPAVGEVVEVVTREVFSAAAVPVPEGEDRPALAFSMTSLDTVAEPDEKDTFVGKEKEAYRAQYAGMQVSENKPDADVKATGTEDYEKHGSERQRAFLKYAARIRRSPYQAIRWGFGAKPLSINGTRHPERDPCPNCGAARVPEAQLVSSALTYLPGLEFGTVTMYTCSAMCYAGDKYIAEDVVVDVEPEF